MKYIYTFLFLGLSYLGFSQVLGTSDDNFLFRIVSPASIAVDYSMSDNEIGGQTDGDGAGTPWGADVTETICGQLVWARTSTGDSLLCSPATNDLNGKIALIRRGTCGFSLKTYHAQLAGASAVVICNHYNTATENSNTIVNMLGGDSLALVNIPAIFMSRAQCESIMTALDNGQQVDACFYTPYLYSQEAAYSYSTPASQVVELQNLSVNVVNRQAEPINATAYAKITDPSGNITELETSHLIEPGVDSAFTFDPYLPEATGTYNIEYTTNLTDQELLTASFDITDYTWAHDTDRDFTSAGPDSANFEASTYKYQTAGLYLLGGQDAVATYATFGVSGAASVYNPDEPDANNVLVYLYNADADGDGVLDLSGDFSDLAENVVALGSYAITGQEADGTLIDVELESIAGPDEPITLVANGAYYLSLLFDRSSYPSAKCISFVTTPVTHGATNLNYTPLQTDALYSGWSGEKIVQRLQTLGYGVDNEEVTLLDKSSFDVSPNPVSTELNVSFDLDKEAKSAIIGITDRNGSVMKVQNVNNVYKNTVKVDVSGLSAGVYFITFKADNAFRTKKFVVIK
ncbi:MAG: T9SS type A sorting domain-containing protein [Saprospiraceae bacterium]|nr:T9SS type A sorting domain-containing protein [Saprospiraceae bacterium]